MNRSQPLPPASATEAIAVADRLMYTVKQDRTDGVSFATLDHDGLHVDRDHARELAELRQGAVAPDRAEQRLTRG